MVGHSSKNELSRHLKVYIDVFNVQKLKPVGKNKKELNRSVLLLKVIFGTLALAPYLNHF